MEQHMTLTVIQKTNYGQIAFYPACELASKFCALLGTKTLTTKALKQIADMGIKVEVKVETVKF
jgi:hypothetical protein